MIRKIQIIALLIFLTGQVKTQDYAYDRKMGEESAKQVEMMMGLYNDSTLNAYVNAVGARLVSALGKSPFRFEFYIADMAEPNAFALPGGFIYVSRGLLSLVNEEDELAGVIGHEMIHVTKRHSIKQMKKSILPSILMIPGALVGGFVNEDLGNIINAPITVGSELFLMNYSRKQEKEADIFGIELASEAGYNPDKLAVILHQLSQEIENLTGEAEQKSYFSSHPYTPRRVSDLGEHAKTISWNSGVPVAKNKLELYSNLNHMVVGQNPEQGLFKDNLFLHPGLALSMPFPPNWNTLNVPIAAGAFEENGKAQILLTLERTYNTADSAADAFASKYASMSGKTSVKNQSVEVNGLKGRHVSFSDQQAKSTILLNAWWIQKDENLINVIAVSEDAYEKLILESVAGLRAISDEEKQMITELKLKVAEAQEGESLEEFGKRTGNAWSTKETALMNGLEENIKLQKGQVLKIAVSNPYFN